MEITELVPSCMGIHWDFPFQCVKPWWEDSYTDLHSCIPIPPNSHTPSTHTQTHKTHSFKSGDGQINAKCAITWKQTGLNVVHNVIELLSWHRASSTGRYNDQRNRSSPNINLTCYKKNVMSFFTRRNLKWILFSKEN